MRAKPRPTARCLIPSASCQLIRSTRRASATEQTWRLQKQIIHGRFEKGIPVERRLGLPHDLGKHLALGCDDFVHRSLHLGVGRD